MAEGDHPSGLEPFAVMWSEGFELGEPRAALAAAADRVGVRDVWTDSEDHAAWVVASKVGLPLERVAVGRSHVVARRETVSALLQKR